MPVERLHTFDRVISAAVLVSQFAIAWFLFGEWRRRMKLGWFRAAVGALAFMWVVVAYGLWLSVRTNVHNAWGPPWLHSIGSTAEFVWGMLSCLAMAIYGVYRLVSTRWNPKHLPGRRRALQTAAVAAFAVPVVSVAFGGIVTRRRYGVREVELPIRNLHRDLQGLRIAQVSDFHVSPFLSVRDAAYVVDMTNELKPNLAFMTGDLITEAGDPLDDAIREICRLRADAGVFGCLGNHEGYVRCEAYVTRQAAKRGVSFLRGEARQLRFGAATLNVAGVDFQPSRYRDRYLKGTEKLMESGVPNLLLSHNPDVFPKAAEQGWDAMLSGHTHGGQVTVEIFEQTMNLARFVTPYVAGLYRQGDSSCYVNRGIGTIGMPVRIGEAPEITLLRLVTA